MTAVVITAKSMDLINPTPVLHERKAPRRKPVSTGDEESREEIDASEIFEHIRDVQDPEHPYTLEQLNVVTEDHIEVSDAKGLVSVHFTPTVQHCSMATLIGLCLRVKLGRALPPRFKIDVSVTPGAHATDAAVTKQLQDKERVAAALENPNLMNIVNRCLARSEAALQADAQA